MALGVRRTGTSDPVSFECNCEAREVGGSILLFYRYFSAPPTIPKSQTTDVQDLFSFYSSICERLSLKGKIRVATEGFNVTVGGTKSRIQEYIQACLQHWSFAGLDLDTQTKQDEFFKPSNDGCGCAFQTLSVKITAEITPLGVTNYTPKDWDVVKSLPPADFHAKCWDDGKKVLIDVRNHYESRIGYFIDPVSGGKAVMPEVRRFSQFPLYIKTHLQELEGLHRSKDILTYCTGGIRCEKSVRWMAERLKPEEGRTIYTLQGGIAAYLTWMDDEIGEGRKTAEDSLFRGRNYVFDGRGSVGLAAGSHALPVSRCHICDTPCDRLDKCRSSLCHLVLVVCEICAGTRDPRCCQSCRDNEASEGRGVNRTICSCERARESRLRNGNGR